MCCYIVIRECDVGVGIQICNDEIVMTSKVTYVGVNHVNSI